ncbi:MAG: DUF4082 domain-containing protein, partial [Thermoplasmata archaeon]|nr:DUF4082 domain-containing protein [Thermoplasmata archaeon]
MSLYSGNPSVGIALLGSSSMTAGDYWNSFIFYPPIAITPGEEYFFSISTIGAGNYDVHGVQVYNPYTHGSSWWGNPGWSERNNEDLAFKICSSDGLDQQQLTHGNSGSEWRFYTSGATNRSVGQSFTPGTGVEGVSQIDVFLEIYSGVPDSDIYMILWEDSMDGTELGRTTLAYADFVDIGWNSFEFESPVAVTAGTTYNFSLHSDTPTTGDQYWAKGDNSNPYAGGIRYAYNGGWSSYATEDLAFRTYAGTPVPTGWTDIGRAYAVDFADICYSSYSNEYVAVGYNHNGTGAVFSYDLSSGAWAEHTAIDLYGVYFRAIAWHPTLDYGVICGNASSGKGVVYWLDLPNATLHNVTQYDHTFYTVGWDDDGYEAIIGGEYGILVSFKNSTLGCTLLYANSYAYTAPDEYIDWYGICIRPPNSPSFAYLLGRLNGALPQPGRMGIKTLGGAEGGGEIGVGVVLPTIEVMEIYQYGGPRKKGKVDAATQLSFYVEANLSGYDQDFWANATMEITCWYDHGDIGSNSKPPPERITPPEPRETRNSYFLLNYTGGSNSGAGWSSGTWEVLFPDTSLSYKETSLHSQYEYVEEVGNYSHHHLYINVTLGPQLHNASGPSAAWVDTGDATPELGFTNTHTWDVNTTLVFINGTDSLWNARYTEFGIYKYLSIAT